MTAIAETRGRAGQALWISLLIFSLPVIASLVLQSIADTFTGIYLGRALGPHGLGAIAVVIPFIGIFLALVGGISSAGAVLVGQAYGAGAGARVKQVAGTALTASAIVGVAFALFGTIFAGTLMRWVNTPAELMEEATRYGRISFAFLPVILLATAYTSIVRGTKDSVTPFLYLTVASGVSVGLVPVLLPIMGAAGGATATSTAHTVALIFLFVYLLARRHPLAADRGLIAALGIDWKLLKLMLWIGFPSALQILIMAASPLVLSSFVNRFGTDASAANGAVARTVEYVAYIGTSIGISASVFASLAIGGGESEGVRRIARTGLALYFALAASLILVFYGFSHTIVALFLPKGGPAADIAHRAISIMLWSYLGQGMSYVLVGVMRASGVVLWPTAITIVGYWGIQLPTAYYLSHAIGLDGVWIATPIAFVATFLMESAYFLLVWSKRPLKRLV